MVFGMEKFNHFTYGRKVTVESNHKPLKTIHKKPLASAPKRLQGMLLRLQRYESSIVYKQGKDMYIADTFSRAFIAGSPSNLSRQLECVNMVDYLPISSARLRAIQDATTSYETLQTLKTVIINGSPATRQELHTNILPYFHIRDELAAQNGIIFRGDRCIIPKALRPLSTPPHRSSGN